MTPQISASGLLNTKEIAQEYVSTGVGLLAGSSIFLLTILWGTCVIASRQDFSNSSKVSNGSNSTQTSRQRLHALLTGMLLLIYLFINKSIYKTNFIILFSQQYLHWHVIIGINNKNYMNGLVRLKMILHQS